MPNDADPPLALDTSVAVPLLVATHTAHRQVVDWWRRRPIALSGHALIETYSVLTRLPGDIRLTAADAARLLTERFEAPLLVRPADARRCPALFASAGIAGGASYDALVALAAMGHGAVLATRDARALSIYQAIGATVVLVA